MFNYQEKQQVKGIILEVLEENNLIKPVNNSAKKTICIKNEKPKDDLCMTDEERKLYNEYVANEGCVGIDCLPSGVFGEKRWLEMYRNTGRTTPSSEEYSKFIREERTFEKWYDKVGSFYADAGDKKGYDEAYARYKQNPKSYEPKMLRVEEALDNAYVSFVVGVENIVDTIKDKFKSR